MRSRRNGRRKIRSIRIEIPKSVKTMLKVVSIFMVLLCFSTIFALITSVSEKILARVHLNGVDLSNLTIDEGYQKLNETLTNNKKKNIVLAYEEY